MPVDVVREKVQRILTEKLGSVRVDADGDFIIENESAFGFVSVMERGDQTIVKLHSPLLRDVDLTPELYQWVATNGQARWFGHARVFTDDDGSKGVVVWEHDLLGDYLDEEELMVALIGVMGGSNDLDDDLQARFGGRRGID